MFGRYSAGENPPMAKSCTTNADQTTCSRWLALSRVSVKAWRQRAYHKGFVRRRAPLDERPLANHEVDADVGQHNAMARDRSTQGNAKERCSRAGQCRQ
jgi:hypothetical protein